MDWSIIVNIVMGILVLIALPLVLRKRKKAGPLKREEFCRHLQGMGIEATLRERDSYEEKIGVSRSLGAKVRGNYRAKRQKYRFGKRHQYGESVWSALLLELPGEGFKHSGGAKTQEDQADHKEKSTSMGQGSSH